MRRAAFLLLLCAQAGAAANRLVPLETGWTVGANHTPIHVPHTASELVGAFVTASRADEVNAAKAATRFENRFQAPTLERGTRVFLEVLNAASAAAEINGQPAGKARPSEFALSADITSLVKTGENTIALNTGDLGIQGGVRLRFAGPVRLDSDRILVDTPDWKGGPARVRVRTNIVNDSALAVQTELIVTITGPDGKPIARTISDARQVSASGSAPVEVSSEPIAAPPLWSPSAPRLCSVSVELRAGGSSIEKVRTNFGFRWFSFDADRGFF